MGPISTDARDGFIAVVLVAVIIAVLTGSILVASALVATCGLCVGAALLIRGHRAQRQSQPKTD